MKVAKSKRKSKSTDDKENLLHEDGAGASCSAHAGDEEGGE
jgi:hypothetical protein